MRNRLSNIPLKPFRPSPRTKNQLITLYEENRPEGSNSQHGFTVTFHELQHQQLTGLAKRNGVSPEQMIEEIVNSFLLADTGSASHD